jgi:hypothetical protein
MAINPSEFKTRTALEQLTLKIMNERKDFVADEVFTPVYTPEKDIFKVYQYDGRELRDIDTASDSKSSANKVDYGVFSRDRNTTLHKLSIDIDPRDEKVFDGAVADVSSDAADALASHLLIRRERAFVTLATTASNYPASLTKTLVDASTRLTDSGGDIEAEAEIAQTAIRTACGKAPNAACLSWTGLQKLKRSPSVVNRVKYGGATYSGARATEDAIRDLLGVEELVISKAVYNSAAEGAARSMSDIWADDLLFFVKDASPRKKSMRYGACYVRNEMYTYRGEDPKRGSGEGRIQELEMGWEWLLAPGAVVGSSDDDFIAGYLLKNIY